MKNTIGLLLIVSCLACQNAAHETNAQPGHSGITEMILDPVANAKPIGEDGIVKMDDVLAAAPVTAFVLTDNQVQTVKQQLNNSVVENLKVATL